MAEFINTVDLLGDKECLGGLISHTINEFNDDVLTTLCQNAFYNNYVLKKMYLPSVETLSTKSIYCCKRIKDIDLRGLQRVSSGETNAIYSLRSLTEISIPNVLNLNAGSFLYDTPIRYVELPSYSTNTIASPFSPEYGVSSLDVCNINKIYSGQFKSDYNLSSLILRSAAVATLDNISAFTGTPIAAGYGYIYVPSNLVTSYKTATNWSTFADQIVSIDEYPKEFIGGTITDTWTQIFAAEANGTYKTKYSIGDTKALNMNGACVLMQIVAFDEDDLADDSGKAKISWISVGTIASMPPSFERNSITWETSDIRKYLQDTIYPTIENTVKNNIKTVHKISRSAASGVTTTGITDDRLWIPSYYEVVGTSQENDGALYTEIFGNNTSDSRKIKNRGPCSTSTSVHWFTRTSIGNSLYYVKYNGDIYGANSSDQHVVLGFCT